MHLKHHRHIYSHNTMTSTSTSTNTRLYDQACVAAQKRFKSAKLSVPDELHSLNDNTNWDALSRKEFREVMIRMETITADFYNDCTSATYPIRSSAIKKFWANEWGCEYVPESGKWLDLATNAVIKSETEKKARRDAKKASKAEKKQQQLDEEDEACAEAYAQVRAEEQAQKALVKQQNQNQQQQQAYDDWYDAEEEAYAEAYAQARSQEEEKIQFQQKEAQAYLDSFNYTSEEEQEKQEKQEPVTSRISCQPVLYIEELTDREGDPDWRAYIYYDERIRRYVLKGTRRSLRATSKTTMFPEIKLCFRSSRELAHYLCSSTDSLLNVTLYAMSSATVKESTFAELCALPPRGHRTELFGYDYTRPRFSTFVNYLCIVRDIDATHSTFASF